ncbi:MAG: DUF86 domain-containing protein [Oscillibacter sp.]|nr:DUF86 domain-containing protein [Oscillibacter sp.]MBQ9617922.1 DUF86 domain-containing protein [Oscillibacter sp.]
MEMNERDRSILEHMVSYCADIEAAVARFGDSYAQFSADKEYRNACAMCVLQIGELSGHLSAEFRSAHRDIPWNAIKAMRNVMAHQYGSISVETVWEAIERDIPELKAFCLQSLGKG